MTLSKGPIWWTVWEKGPPLAWLHLAPGKFYFSCHFYALFFSNHRLYQDFFPPGKWLSFTCRFTISRLCRHRTTRATGHFSRTTIWWLWLPSSEFFQLSCLAEQSRWFPSHAVTVQRLGSYPFLPGLELVLFLQILAVDVAETVLTWIPASAKERRINTNFYEQYIYYHLKLWLIFALKFYTTARRSSDDNVWDDHPSWLKGTGKDRLGHWSAESALFSCRGLLSDARSVYIVHVYDLARVCAQKPRVESLRLSIDVYILWTIVKLSSWGKEKVYKMVECSYCSNGCFSRLRRKIKRPNISRRLVKAYIALFLVMVSHFLKEILSTGIIKFWPFVLYLFYSSVVRMPLQCCFPLHHSWWSFFCLTLRRLMLVSLMMMHWIHAQQQLHQTMLSSHHDTIKILITAPKK